MPFLASGDERWVAADAIPERERASAGRSLAVTVHVEVPLHQAEAFDACADGDRYSGWLGVPVTIRGAHFAATLEWRTQVRGTYEVVSPPQLLAMRWDFDDDTVPVPGRELVAYLRVQAVPGVGARVEVHQFADDEQQASFLSDAWSMVLGRFARRGLPRPGTQAAAAEAEHLLTSPASRWRTCAIIGWWAIA